jgi:hypothetical protein
MPDSWFLMPGVLMSVALSVDAYPASRRRDVSGVIGPGCVLYSPSGWSAVLVALVGMYPHSLSDKAAPTGMSHRWRIDPLLRTTIPYVLQGMHGEIR